MKQIHRLATGSASLSRVLLLAFGLLGGLMVATPAPAQGQPVDPPGRVARLSEADGQVWLYNADSNEWLAIQRNRPLTSGDRVATDNGARAEISLGTTTLRLDAATELEIVDLDDRAFHMRLHGGSVAARLRTSQSVAEFGLETEEGRFRVATVGRYRFDRQDQASELTVYSGQAVFEGRNSALPITTGQRAQFWLDQAGAAQYNMVAPSRDAFAAWNDERDRSGDRPPATRFVSPEMTGAADLDSYGRWEQTPEYGAIWTPRAVAVDWAPYSAGHWAWVRPWGWTWVDDAPWGFAPFHYGRWVYHRNAWCWAPGTYVARPVYAPALVAWIGGPRVGISLSAGSGGPPVGWFPLAPHEVYVPSYRSSPGYVRNVNYTHVTNITNITNIVNNTNGAGDRRDFQNRKFPNAVTVVPASVLINRQQVAPAAAQWRGNAQVRALVAEARPAPAMNAAPVAAPQVAARPAEGRALVRPPFDARVSGPGGGPPPLVQGGRAGPSERFLNRGPTPGERGAGPAAPVVPAPVGAAPVAASPAVPATAVHRPPQPGTSTQVGEMPRPVFPARPDGVARPPRELAPRAGEGPRPLGEPPRVADAPRVNGAPRVVDSPRFIETPRPAEPPRIVDAPRGTDSPRAIDSPRGLNAGRRGDIQRPVDAQPPAVVPAPRQAEPVRAPRVMPPEAPRAVVPEAPRPAVIEAPRPTVPEGRATRPEAPRHDDRRGEEKREDKR